MNVTTKRPTKIQKTPLIKQLTYLSLSVTASLIAIFVIGLTVSLSMAFGWMASTVGTVVTFIVALLLGILAGCIIRRNVWIMM